MLPRIRSLCLVLAEPVYNLKVATTPFCARKFVFGGRGGDVPALFALFCCFVCLEGCGNGDAARRAGGCLFSGGMLRGGRGGDAQAWGGDFGDQVCPCPREQAEGAGRGWLVVGTQRHLREQLLVASWDSSLRPQRPDPSLGDFAVPPSHPQPALTGVRMVYPSFPKA